MSSKADPTPGDVKEGDVIRDRHSLRLEHARIFEDHFECSLGGRCGLSDLDVSGIAPVCASYLDGLL